MDTTKAFRPEASEEDQRAPKNVPTSFSPLDLMGKYSFP
jgi:hypothetical protein